MSVSLPTTPRELAPLPAGALANFRLIPRIETYPAVVAFAQTLAGKLVLLALFGLGLAYNHQSWEPLILFLALITFLPGQRRILLTLSTLAFAFLVTWTSFKRPLYVVTLLCLTLLLGAFLFWSAARWPRSWYGRNTILIFLSGFAALVLIAATAPQNVWFSHPLWDFTYMLSTYMWFIGYSLLDAKLEDHDRFGLQLGCYRPFWGSTNTPFAKGAAYLRRIEARNAEQLAITQLKGLKLLAWASLISLFSNFYQHYIYESFPIPTYSQALSLSASHVHLPWYVCWASLIGNFFGGIISLSIFGHTIIACCRMAGFNALRNTYRPLSSRTVAEFFNRYYFYFKELLVDFFFYPIFLRCFRKNQKLRLVVSIFAAACFGNAFYHFSRDLNLVYSLGLARALQGYQVYLFYCFALATAISISRLRPRSPMPPGFIRARLLPSFSVVLVYCLLDVFGSTERNYPLTEHFRFFAHLFNLNL
ncbi:MAG: hypothetical protein JWO71_2409 [Candidatus Acidoferrum typicum]|nr:hypothetical protein [Candidatus Acidoferrum typicum]